MIKYNLEYFNKDSDCWKPSMLNPKEGFTCKKEALEFKAEAERIYNHIEYKITEIVNGKPDLIGQQIRAILNK